MPIEAATSIPTLDPSNPLSTDPISDGDNHIRLLKTILKFHWPALNGVVNANAADLNLLAGSAASGLTAAELGYVKGVTSPIQAQINSKVPTNGVGATGVWNISINGRGFPKRPDGADLNFPLLGYALSPTYVLGGEAGVAGIQNVNAYQSNKLSVAYAISAGGANYANSAGYATNAGNANFANTAGSASTAGFASYADNINLPDAVFYHIVNRGVGGIGTYALMKRINHANAAQPNDLDSGSNLVYSDAAGNTNGWVGVGTWRIYGYQSSGTNPVSSTSLRLRIL